MAFVPHAVKPNPQKHTTIGSVDNYYESVDPFDPDDQVNMTGVWQTNVDIYKGADKSFKDKWLVSFNESMYTLDDLRELMKEIERKVSELEAKG